MIPRLQVVDKLVFPWESMSRDGARATTIVAVELRWSIVSMSLMTSEVLGIHEGLMAAIPRAGTSTFSC